MKLSIGPAVRVHVPEDAFAGNVPLVAVERGESSPQ